MTLTACPRVLLVMRKIEGKTTNSSSRRRQIVKQYTVRMNIRLKCILFRFETQRFSKGTHPKIVKL